MGFTATRIGCCSQMIIHLEQKDFEKFSKNHFVSVKMVLYFFCWDFGDDTVKARIVVN